MFASQRVGRLRSVLSLLISAALLLGLAMTLVPGPAPAEEPAPLKIGIPGSLFRDIPKAAINALTPMFTQLMESQIGMKGQIVFLSGPNEVGQQLNDNQIQLAVMHGFEFAWEQNKHKGLKPLVIAVNQSPKLTAQLVVAKESSFNKMEDLKGQSVAIPRGTREHCRLFLSRQCRTLGHQQDKFFSTQTNPAHMGAALEELLTGKVQATVVDGAAWETYKRSSPGKAGRLKLLAQSEAFPTGVVAYKEGNISEANLKKFTDGLTSAHERPAGVQLMTMWKMNRFEVVPAEYHQMLSDIVRAYPPPIGDEP